MLRHFYHSFREDPERNGLTRNIVKRKTMPHKGIPGGYKNHHRQNYSSEKTNYKTFNLSNNAPVYNNPISMGRVSLNISIKIYIFHWSIILISYRISRIGIIWIVVCFLLTFNLRLKSKCKGD